MAKPRHDAVNHPAHYIEHPSGVEDLQKAIWYLNDEINKRNKKGK